MKAHIIPEAFVRVLRDSSDGRPPMLIGSADVQRFAKRSPIGSYDQTILCKQCEQTFALWDDYAATILIQQLSNFEIWDNGFVHPMFVMREYDYATLKLFFISCAWRVAVSSRPEYQSCRLGPFEQLARDALLSRRPGDKHFFSTMLTRWVTRTERDKDAALTLSADPMRFAEGTNGLEFCLGELVAHIKVDSRELPDVYEPFLLQAERGLVIVGREFASSRDKREILRHLADAKKRMGKFDRKPNSALDSKLVN